jgi:hypothetical protein
LSTDKVVTEKLTGQKMVASKITTREAVINVKIGVLSLKKKREKKVTEWS